MIYRKWLDEWLGSYVKPIRKLRTYIKYKRAAEIHIMPIIGDIELDDLSARVLQQFASELICGGLAPNTVNGILSVVRISLLQAVAAGATQAQYSEAIVHPNPREKRVQCLSVTDQHRIENYILTSHDDRLFGIVLCMYTGLRIGELLSLTWSDIDLEHGTLSVNGTCRDEWHSGRYCKIIEPPKTACSERMIPIPRQLLLPLLKIKERGYGKYVVPGKSDNGAEVRTYQRTFARLLKRLGITHVGFHVLRHTFATRALEIGMDVKTLSEILGHKNATVTLSRYAHSCYEHKAEMMNKVGNAIFNVDNIPAYE